MKSHDEDIHTKNVTDWFSSVSQGLTPGKQVVLMEKAIKSVETRARQTLSGVTLLVVIDRVLSETKQKFPVISDIGLDDQSLDFSQMNKEKSALEKVEALTILLIDLLRVLARLTSNILNTPLHNELKKVTKDSGES